MGTRGEKELKGSKKISWGDVYINYLDCGGGLMDVLYIKEIKQCRLKYILWYINDISVKLLKFVVVNRHGGKSGDFNDKSKKFQNKTNTQNITL